MGPWLVHLQCSGLSAHFCVVGKPGSISGALQVLVGGCSAAGGNIGLSSGFLRLWRRARIGRKWDNLRNWGVSASCQVWTVQQQAVRCPPVWGVRGCPGFSHRFLFVSVSLRAGRSTCPQQVVTHCNALSVQGRTACVCGKPCPCETECGQDRRFGRIRGEAGQC